MALHFILKNKPGLSPASYGLISSKSVLNNHMRLESLQLTQFKNYLSYQIDLAAPIVAVTGRNGMGKTNLLDAVYYLCFLRSYFQRTDAAVVQHGATGFRVQGSIQTNSGLNHISCVLRETGKKESRLNDVLYTRISSHLGKFPCVMIAPDDIEIITGGSEQRRRLLDTLLCQINPEYLQALSQYNKVLLQRNAALKQMASFKQTDHGLLDALDQQLVQYGEYIFTERNAFLKTFNQQVTNHYQFIAGEPDPVELVYESSLLQQTFPASLAQNRNRDLLLQRTTVGIHKDDLDIRLDSHSFKQIASQGQRKSMLFALKLAEYEALELGTGQTPFLLLDDIFEKLDEQRMTNLLQWIASHQHGQVFLSDTHPERIEACLKKVQVSYQLITLT
jgi:DNA replication and repair protein RecF